ncbi:di-trans,poly-cis-decaprenylcistransferase [Helicobacter winghamensis]|uniref:Isoprenyl transferase n=1 Tax=Helicobacter winghamensis TaxID=157268 RepID=A0A2N3PHV0_9HELI|nr:di-trans,poly-cis-decaprenylcistransferase [Helicobacter winghamensis]EEO25594.1 di-trans,poly-cis-decaprenylcistransferase [Helicobacter winghamensis ATCC BAA-430]PKT77997.1 di-trans,poly-cis-decaprenylcistransferase [Helicobacter winghamensis]PKT78259.1 di-trans,poly-cis-decaprenylcistransferase [Helicobacter winghamensis]PKT78525.1 di-trans,poly-cis-decaprenylcistransferase [Helicobacter winghamensis]PKT80146.1 di-trans,poly-cis-decaprenylcistransferase [Helicobacter winghamensis]
MPKHLAIIMDGNGRWAKNHLQMRTFGHKAGAKKIQEITEFCTKYGIAFLSLYAFSTENWKRPKTEVDFLMRLLEEYLDSKFSTYLNNNIIFKAIGDLSIFSTQLQEKIHSLELVTKEQCNGLTQILALNYGSQDELRRAFLKLVLKQERNFSFDSIENALDTTGIPPVDMLVRTGGEMRLSNFLLWQSAYAELFFTKTLWPSFTSKELEAMLLEFKTRHRRFGGL